MAVDAPHPLEPLDAAEIALARDVLAEAGVLDAHTAVSGLALAEPAKSAVLAWPGAPVTRQAEALLVRRPGGQAVRALVDLGEKAVVRVEDLDAQPAFTGEELLAAVRLVRTDPRWVQALADRGITDPRSVQVDPWPTGSLVPESAAGRRVARCTGFVRRRGAVNSWARPIAGLMALVDVAAGEVLEVVDRGARPVPDEDGEFDRPPSGEFRHVAPLSITQPDGPGFTIDGHRITWQNWELRVSLNALDGLTLHQVGYRDGDELRSVLYRASLAEMAVPYGDPDPLFEWRMALDGGEYGLGTCVNALELGCDCVGEVHYLDAVGVTAAGDPLRRPNAICVHEEDHGIGWKHTDPFTGVAQVRRARRLVISSFYTVGNYDYGAYWYLHQDGSIALEMKLTGIVQTKAGEPGTADPHAVEVAPGLFAPHHQHLFCVRLDMALDGQRNTVHEVDVVPVASATGHAFATVTTPLVSEAVAARDADAARARSWHVVNESRRNRVGAPVGYRLVPHTSAPLLAAPGSAMARRAAFAAHHLWVTEYRPDELRPAGTHPNLSAGDTGIDTWAQRDAPLVDADVVLWHTFGPTHVARTEDWPVMPVARAGFMIEPAGFFDRNPALDVPPSHHC
ncbi:primary-amine oxidase [Pseudonocardia sp. CA-107938]|uniref:primary-amine oxidase n=1 Tax=Pseudonocardia sp. CA-107938 TaxID=3240021 RepID=UPI003D907F78